MSHKTSFFTAGVLALLAIVGLAACGTARGGGPGWRPGTGTYAGHGVSFHYPAGWYQTTPGGGRPLLWSTGVGFDPPDSLYITAHPIGTRVTAQNLSTFIPSVTRTVRLGVTHAGDRLLAGPQAITVGGMPGLQFQGTETNPVGKVTLTIVFNGMTWYDITCAYTPAKARAVQRGCAQVLRTFKVSRWSTAGAPLAVPVPSCCSRPETTSTAIRMRTKVAQLGPLPAEPCTLGRRSEARWSRQHSRLHSRL